MIHVYVQQSEDKVFPEKGSRSLDPEDQEDPQVKEEQEEEWSSQGDEFTTFLFSRMKSEGEEDSDVQQLLVKNNEVPPQEVQEDQEPPHIKEEQLWGPDAVVQSGSAEFSGLKVVVSGEEPECVLNSLKMVEVPVRDVSCNRKSYRCSECWKTFSRSPHLKIHMRTHTGERPFSCLVCGRSFIQKMNLTYHMSVHTGEKRFSCRACKLQFTWYTQLKSHRSICEAAQLLCDQMEDRWAEKLLSCSECGKIFSRKDNLNIHLRIHRGERPFRCSICGRSFRHGGYLTQHMSVHTKENRFSCSVCSERFTWLYQLRRHTCLSQACQLMRTSQDEEQLQDLQESQTAKSRPDDEPPQRHYSPANKEHTDCDGGADDSTSDFHDSQTETREEWRESGAPPSGCGFAAVPEVIPDRKSFSCFECGKRFSRKEHLQTHARIHTGERPFSCSACGKRFGCKRSLLGHMTSHTGEKPFSCSQCGKRFGRMVNLKTHQRLHTGERPFICPFCGKGFTQKVHMTQHTAVHTGEKQFSCSVCDKKFTWLSGFRRHKCGGEQSEPDSSHTEENGELEAGGKAFCCQECGNRFRHKHNLKAHLRIHSGEKPFSCYVCGKRFSASGALTKHLRTHSGEKPFTCTVCGVRFTQGGNLKRHMDQHTGGAREKPFDCSVCGKSFTQVSNMKRHMAQHAAVVTCPLQEVVV